MLEINLKKNLPGFKLDITFAIDQEILAILGPSGSGKTMTLHCIAGLTHPDEGQIKLNDNCLFDSNAKINLPPQARKVGFVFQNYALFPHLTVSENIAFGLNHLTKTQIQEKVAQLLDKMNLSELGKRYPKQLSGGQQQRVALARALAPEPEILLLDEPFSALDTQVKERLELELLSLQNFYKGNILLVTHNLAEGYKLASKIAVYDAGRVVQCDSKQKVMNSPANHAVARLTGVRNLFQGSITEVREKDVKVSVPELNTLLRVETRDSLLPAIDQKVTIGIRPEYVHLSDNPVENTLKCVIERKVDGISSSDCFFNLINKSGSRHWIEAIMAPSDAERIEPGKEYYLHLHPEHLNIIQD